MKDKFLLMVTAVLEGATGLALLALPSSTVSLLLGEGLEAPSAVVVGRVAGAALVAIGVSCGVESKRMVSSQRTSLVLGLLVYNVAVPLLLIGAVFNAGLQGLVLWPASVAHSALAVWCVVCLRQR